MVTILPVAAVLVVCVTSGCQKNLHFEKKDDFEETLVLLGCSVIVSPRLPELPPPLLAALELEALNKPAHNKYNQVRQ